MIKISIPVLVIFLSFPGIAQMPYTLNQVKVSRETFIETDGLSELYNYYYQRIGVTDKLINGKEYIPYYYRSKLKPLLYYGKERTASLILGGRKYNDIVLQYDTYTDDIVYTDTSRIYNNIMYQIALNKNLIDGFELYFGSDSLVFRKFNKASDSDFDLKEGFYELVYDGRSKYIVKHFSAMIEKEGVDEYYYKTSGFLKVNDSYSKIKSSRNFLKQFGSHSEEIRKFARASGIDLHSPDKKEISRILEYYDTKLNAE